MWVDQVLFTVFPTWLWCLLKINNDYVSYVQDGVATVINHQTQESSTMIYESYNKVGRNYKNVKCKIIGDLLLSLW